MPNPFLYGAPVGPSDLIDREAETAVVVDRAVAGHNSRLVAPRRYGKTSLVGRVARDMGNEGWLTVYVNFFGVLSGGDIAERIDRAYAERLQGGLAAWFEGVRRVWRPTARIGGGPLQAELAAEPAGQRPLLERLAMPRRLHEKSGRRVLVVFDEFQDVLAAGAQMDAVIRSEIEHHGPAASYVFAGSHVGMMRQLFGDKRRAFYGQAGAVELGPLAADVVAEHVDRAFAAGGKQVGAALGPLLDASEGHPQRVMLLAHWLWEHTPAGGAADEETWTRALDHVMEREIRDELQATWTALPAGQRRLLAVVADDRLPLFGREAQAQFGLPRGGGLQTTVAALVDRGELVADAGRRTGHRVVDPLLARWVREGRPPGS